MIYFLKKEIRGFSSDGIEAAIRRSALKRNSFIDFQSAVSDIRQEKIFIGTENENELCITRLRTSFERIFPKYIIRFNKSEGFGRYQVRLSVVSFSFLFFLTISILSGIYESIVYREIINDLAMPVFLLSAFMALTFFEFYLTRKAIDRALRMK